MAIVIAQKDIINSVIQFELEALVEDDDIDTNQELKNLAGILSGNREIHTENLAHFKIFFEKPTNFKRIWEYGAITIGEARLCMLDYASKIVEQIIEKTGSSHLRSIWNSAKIKQLVMKMPDHKLQLISYTTQQEHRMILIGQLMVSQNNQGRRFDQGVLTRLGGKKLRDKYFQNYHYNAFKKMIEKSDNKTPMEIYEVIIGLTRMQVRGIRMGLTRKQVTCSSFQKTCIKLIKKLQETVFKNINSTDVFNTLSGLCQTQIDGLAIGLTLNQVKSDSFNKLHLEKLKLIQRKYPERSISDAYNQLKSHHALQDFSFLSASTENTAVPQNNLVCSFPPTDFII